MAEAPLSRILTRWHALAIVIGSIVGTGIYIRPASIAQLLHARAPIVAIWVAAGVLTLCGGLTYAELARRIPRTGGEYAFLRATLGELPAFLFGWMRLTVSVGTCAALAVAVTVFVSDFVDLGAPWMTLSLGLLHDPVQLSFGLRELLATATIGALALLNLNGVGSAGHFQAAVTTLKVAALLTLIVVIFAFGHGKSVPAQTPIVTDVPDGSAWSAALLAALVAFNGWANVAMLAGEVRAAESTIPWALYWGVLCVVALYLLVNLAYLNVLPMSEIVSANSATHPTASSVASRAAVAAVGPKASALLPVLFIVSALGTLHCNLMAVPRIFFAMATDGLMPTRLARTSPVARAPAAAIITVAAIAIFLSVLGSYDRLSSMATFGNILFFALNTVGLLHWRRQRGESPRSGVARWVPWIFLFGSGWLLTSLIARGSIDVMWALVLVAAGIPVYCGVAWTRGRRGSAHADADFP
jgi:basic amino acid/polyamine antiporter, APA family